MLKKFNSFYVFTIALFITLLAVNSYFFKGSKSFLGITYSREYKINVERSALVEDVHVVPGQTVNPGDLLIELSSNALELEIQKLRKEIDQIRSKMEERTELLNSKIALYEAERRMIKSDRDNELSTLRNEIELNRKLTAQFTSEEDRNDSLTALQLELKSVSQKADLLLEELNIRILDTRQEHEFDMAQERSSLALTEQELEWRLTESENLNRYASFQGVIENVYVKPGEQIEAFSNIVSINPVHPTSVVGYLVGKKDRDKQLGEEVIVRSLEHPEFETEGRIIGFGSVVMLPEVLQKSTAVKAFGLEVFIEIPEGNNLPVGEKIIVK
jgi:HlyD family secretion protein